MKIQHLTLLNLNSLRGKHLIDFEASPLRDCGLFAITGPTGSGKTTLLDAITLALYGRVVRFGRSSPDEIMSRGETESFAEVIFSTGSPRALGDDTASPIPAKTYKARWARRRTKSGVAQAPKRELSEHPGGVVIASQANDVNEAVATITGLDFDRFQKSALLAQGEFAAFLRAGAEDRKALLERITGTEIYAELEDMARDIAEQRRKELDLILVQLSATPPLTDAELEQRRRDEAAVTAEIEQRTAQIATLRTTLAIRQQLDQLAAAAEARRIDLQHAREAIDFHRSDLGSLEADRHARPLEPHLREHDRLCAESLALQRDAAAAETLAKERAQAARLAEATLAAAKNQAAAIRRDIETRTPTWDAMLAMDAAIRERESALAPLRLAAADQDTKWRAAERELEAARNAMAAAAERADELRKWLNANAGLASLAPRIEHLTHLCARAEAAQARATALHTEAEAISATQSETRKALTTCQLQSQGMQEKIARQEQHALQQNGELDQLLRGATIATLESNRDKLLSLQTLHGRAEHAAHKLAELDTTLFAERNLLATTQAKITQLQQRQQDIARRLPQATERASLLRRQFDLERRVLDLETERHRLAENCPCPLCGSLDHPYALASPAPNISETERQTLDTEKLAQQLTIESARTAGDLSTVLNTKASLEERIATAAKSRTAALGELTSALAEAADWPHIEAHVNAFATSPAQDFHPLTAQYLAEARQALSNDLAALGDRIRAARTLRQSLDATRQSILLTRQEESTLVLATERLEQQLTQLDAKAGEMRLHAHKASAEKTEALAEIEELLAGTGVTLPDGNVPVSQRNIPNPNWLRQAKDSVTAWSARTAELPALDKIQAEAAGRVEVATGLERHLHAARQQSSTQLLEAEASVRSESAVRTERYGPANPTAERAERTTALAQAERKAATTETTVSEALRQEALATARQAQLSEHLALSQTREASAVQQLNQVCATLGITPDVARKQLLSQADRERLEALDARLHSTLAAATSESTAAESILREKVRAAKETCPASQAPAAQLLTELSSTEQAAIAAHQEKGRISGEIQRDAEIRAAKSQAMEARAAARKEATRWSDLARVLGHGTRKPFSRFAQNLTLSRLTALANIHLTKLNDRYRLERRGDKDMELEVVDGYQSNARRTVESLSGGETFLVSLALALGLSDLASRRVRIDSLFIDEGFGSLDADALDIAIGVLENLQAGGKLVGIISHVDLIRERIATRINVQRLGGGFSSLSLVPATPVTTAEGTTQLSLYEQLAAPTPPASTTIRRRAPAQRPPGSAEPKHELDQATLL
ncbi:hypothetical protein DB346_20305 [Verrucomicrobia bacterium LW23]|nr:hypothetical protein DB346_20305 [Verrucomicrobia bacterium LW23]